MLESLLKPFRASQRNTLAWVIAAIATTGEVRSFAIATTLARWLHVRLDSAVNRFYRLLRNHRIDELLLLRQWVETLSSAMGGKLLIAVDWTE
jgi:hypothetical protein